MKMKKIFTWVIIVIIALFVIGMAKDLIIKSVVTAVSTQVTGAPVHIDSFSLGIFNQTVKITGFKMFNPKGFPKDILVDIAKINVHYDLAALLKQKIHLVSAELELTEMGLEKNKEGQLNADSLKVIQQGKGGKPAKQMPLKIDMLKLGMGRIVYRDYSVGQQPAIKVYEINIHKTYKNITSAEQLAALILAEPMKAAGIQGAKIYGVAMLTGVAILPVAVAATFAGKDNVQQDFAATTDRAYEVSLGVLKKMGNVTREDKENGIIDADINAAKIALKIKKKADNKIELIISARKYWLPKPEIAGGVLYEISKELKKKI